MLPLRAAGALERDRASSVARPSSEQLLWHDLELGVFIHFGINTFHSAESSDGSLDARDFDPTDLDAEQWVSAAKDAGARYVILTAKHRDGFCLWPTETTSYSVKSSPWKDGRGDVVGEVADACRRLGLRFGVYLSPLDRHEPSYADSGAYDEIYARQLEELLTGYGRLVEIWLDDEAPPGRTYDWSRHVELIRAHQPRAMVFNVGAPTVRWSGNDRGLAPEPCWNVVKRSEVLLFADGAAWADGEGSVWLPVECNAPLRDTWFWSRDVTSEPKSLAELLVMYYRSVGRGANLLLGVAPDPRGQLPEADVARLRELGEEVTRRFEVPVGTTSGRGEVIDLELPSRRVVDHVVLEEDLREGERVRRYSVEAISGDVVRVVAAGESIGHRKIHWFEPLDATRLRLRVSESGGEPILREVSAYHVSHGLPYEHYLRAKKRLTSGLSPLDAIRDLTAAIELLPAFGPFHLLRAVLRDQHDDPEGALEDLDRVLALEVNFFSLLHVRAGVLFELERFAESVRDYDAAAAFGEPHDEASCWERGLARYYAGDFAGARAQFAAYHRVGELDIENGLWHFLCTAEVEGIDAAREGALEYPRRVREPFPALLDLYLGNGTEGAVLEQAVSPELRPEERAARLFYAHYYLGKYFELTGERERAKEHFEHAVSHPLEHFMHECARIDLARAKRAGESR